MGRRTDSFFYSFISPALLRLPLQKNPVDTRQIRNCWPRRLPPPRKAQMVPRQKPYRLIRRPLAAPQSQKHQKENMDAPPGYSYPKTPGLRPHKPQRPWQSKGKPTSRNRIAKPLQPPQEKNKNPLKIQRPWMGQNSEKVESKNSTQLPKNTPRLFRQRNRRRKSLRSSSSKISWSICPD